MLDIDISGHQVQKSYAQFRGPRNIMLDITKRCNFFCKHCYNESASYYTGDLDDESMMKIADQIIEVKPVLVCFCGGEPMVRFELVKKLAKKLTENEILVNMVSNGYLMDEKKLAELYESGMQNIQISLDSNKPEVMDYFRGHKGAFKGAINAMNLIQKFGNMPTVHLFLQSLIIKT